MAAKKKKVAKKKAIKQTNSGVKSTFKKRSKAAKKGWETRRAKKIAKQNAKRIRNVRLAIPQPRKKRKQAKSKRLKLAGKSNEELKQIIREQEEKLRVIQETEGWVDAMPPEYIHRNGTIALFPSRARHLGQLTDHMQMRLRAAKDEGLQEFELECYAIADEYDIPAREIFTLGLSDWTD